jgi:ribosome recycling factor
MDLDEAQLTAEESMEKAVEYLKNELRGVRTGRASTGLVEFIKVDYYGSPTDLRQLAMINAAEATQLLIKPFDASSMQTIVKAIQTAGLGLNPIPEKNQIRISLPPLSGDRRQQLATSVKHMGDNAKVAIRNARRDGNKHVDQAGKDKSMGLSEDDIEKAKKDIQDLVKKYEDMVDHLVEGKTKEIQEI